MTSPKNKKLVAAIAVRNTGSRLYGKPSQNLDSKKGITILEFLVRQLQQEQSIDEVALAISEGVGNAVFTEVAEKLGISYVIGDEQDVLGRLIKCAEATNATDVFRVTSESPFPYYEAVNAAVSIFYDLGLDALLYDEIIDGCGFEVLGLDALKKSHRQGEDCHRSELCTLYLRENPNQFKIKKLTPDEALIRNDLRLTVDYPEDLIVCRKVYEALGSGFKKIRINDIIKFLDENPELKKLIAPYTESGYNMMYK